MFLNFSQFNKVVDPKETIAQLSRAQNLGKFPGTFNAAQEFQPKTTGSQNYFLSNAAATRGGLSNQERAAQSIYQAASQIGDVNLRNQFLRDLGLSINNRGGIQGPGLSDPQLLQRLNKAIQSSNPTTSTGRGGQITQYNPAQILENFGETYPQQLARQAAEAKEYEERPFRELAAAEESLRQQQAAYQAQLAEESRIKAELAAELKATEEKARIAGKKSVAASGRSRSQAQLEASQLQIQQQRTATQGQQMQREGRVAGATVGQPGRARTRVSTGLAIGGYGGSSASRVSPTGLNI